MIKIIVPSTALTTEAISETSPPLKRSQPPQPPPPDPTDKDNCTLYRAYHRSDLRNLTSPQKKPTASERLSSMLSRNLQTPPPGPSRSM
ncbi:hypothetical protein AVEN_24606-1 [Araneus ventricosus]|uniref:Uncharacterized protein n=1 Tax=Araneus ventricosus TaxID=182803 RepID=A0A4Y2IJM5_ARAVE|nr:hypothetical protein AVEN_24606-1 [Araneus ventricosus]